MAMARPIEMDEPVTVSDDARRRWDSARVRQLAYKIKTRAPDLSDDDAEQLAFVIFEASMQNVVPSGEDIRSRLRDKGRTAHAADRIATAVGL
jgi:hypothetical protein